MDKGKVVDIILLDFRMPLITSLMASLSNCEINRFTLCWRMNRLGGRPQRGVVNGATSGWWSVPIREPTAQF